MARAASSVLVLAAVPLAALVLPCASVAAQRCPPAMERWAAECLGGGEPVRVVTCTDRHLVLDVGAPPLRVDVEEAPEHAFREVGRFGISPVGEFPDWATAPARERALFEEVVDCVSLSPPELAHGMGATEAPEIAARLPSSRAPTSPFSWALLLGGVASLAAMLLRYGRALGRLAVAPLVLGLCTFVLRRVFVADGYFHQNGQGPLWIAHALGTREHDYGPGYAQLFGGLASASGDPDFAVFTAQSVLGAVAIAALPSIARAVGASPLIAWSLALSAASSPLLARIAASESYLATQGSLLVLATAVLLVGFPPAAGQEPAQPGRPSLGTALLASTAAGLFVAQLALVHPLGWIPAAFLPFPLFLGAGPARTRALRALGAACVVAGVVVGISGPHLLAVIDGPLGLYWLDPSRSGGAVSAGTWLLPLVGVALACVALWFERGSRMLERGPRAATALALLGALVALVWRTDLLGPSAPAIHHAYAWLSLGPAVALLAALLAPMERSGARAGLDARALAAAVLALAVLWHLATAPETLTRPTDAREAALVRAWRPSLPDGALVVHLERAERQLSVLPLYGEPARALPLRGDEPVPEVSERAPAVFLYRGGICSTVRGRAFCDALESQYVLQPIATAVLPAEPSILDLTYDTDAVEVGLYRIVRRAD